MKIYVVSCCPNEPDYEQFAVKWSPSREKAELYATELQEKQKKWCAVIGAVQGDFTAAQNRMLEPYRKGTRGTNAYEYDQYVKSPEYHTFMQLHREKMADLAKQSTEDLGHYWYENSSYFVE